MSLTEEQVRSIVLDDIINGASGRSVVQLSRDLVQAAKDSFDEQALAITLTRNALEGVFESMRVMHDSFETKAGEAKADVGSEMASFQTQQQVIVAKLVDQIAQSTAQDTAIQAAQV